MKIRIQGNTIRFRVKSFETEAIWKQGGIEEVLEFGPSDNDKFRFQINSGDAFAIDQENSLVKVVIPKKLVETWATTDLVGFEEIIKTSKGSDVKVLIEKDFACLDGDREEEEGSYPNPMEDATC